MDRLDAFIINAVPILKGIGENKNGDDGVRFVVKTAGEAMRVDGVTGYCGIGATNPVNPLFVKHATSGSMVIHSNNDTAGTMSTLYFKSVNTSE